MFEPRHPCVFNDSFNEKNMLPPTSRIDSGSGQGAVSKTEQVSTPRSVKSLPENAQENDKEEGGDVSKDEERRSGSGSSPRKKRSSTRRSFQSRQSRSPNGRSRSSSRPRVSSPRRTRSRSCSADDLLSPTPSDGDAQDGQTDARKGRKATTAHNGRSRSRSRSKSCTRDGVRRTRSGGVPGSDVEVPDSQTDARKSRKATAPHNGRSRSRSRSKSCTRDGVRRTRSGGIGLGPDGKVSLLGSSDGRRTRRNSDKRKPSDRSRSRTRRQHNHSNQHHQPKNSNGDSNRNAAPAKLPSRKRSPKREQTKTVVTRSNSSEDIDRHSESRRSSFSKRSSRDSGGRSTDSIGIRSFHGCSPSKVPDQTSTSNKDMGRADKISLLRADNSISRESTISLVSHGHAQHKRRASMGGPGSVSEDSSLPTLDADRNSIASSLSRSGHVQSKRRPSMNGAGKQMEDASSSADRLPSSKETTGAKPRPPSISQSSHSKRERKRQVDPVNDATSSNKGTPSKAEQGRGGNRRHARNSGSSEGSDPARSNTVKRRSETKTSKLSRASDRNEPVVVDCKKKDDLNDQPGQDVAQDLDEHIEDRAPSSKSLVQEASETKTEKSNELLSLDAFNRSGRPSSTKGILKQKMSDGEDEEEDANDMLSALPFEGADHEKNRLFTRLNESLTSVDDGGSAAFGSVATSSSFPGIFGHFNMSATSIATTDLATTLAPYLPRSEGEKEKEEPLQSKHKPSEQDSKKNPSIARISGTLDALLDSQPRTATLTDSSSFDGSLMQFPSRTLGALLDANPRTPLAAPSITSSAMVSSSLEGFLDSKPRTKLAEPSLCSSACISTKFPKSLDALLDSEPRPFPSTLPAPSICSSLPNSPSKSKTGRSLFSNSAQAGHLFEFAFHHDFSHDVIPEDESVASDTMEAPAAPSAPEKATGIEKRDSTFRASEKAAKLLPLEHVKVHRASERTPLADGEQEPKYLQLDLTAMGNGSSSQEVGGDEMPTFDAAFPSQFGNDFPSQFDQAFPSDFDQEAKPQQRPSSLLRGLASFRKASTTMMGTQGAEIPRKPFSFSRGS